MLPYPSLMLLPRSNHPGAAHHPSLKKEGK